jgi:hypothetical protein
VAGVDEADFVKNDGTRIFVLSGQTLYSAKSWPPQDLALAGKLQIEGWPSTMFLDGNQVVVFSSIWTASPTATGSATMLPCSAAGCSGWTTTKITVVDVSTLAAPEVQAELYLPGYSAGARRIGSSVRVVLSDSVRWPEGIRWWPPYDPVLYQDPVRYIAAIDALENQNEGIIRATPLEKWFPLGERKLGDGTLVGVSRASIVGGAGVLYANHERLYLATPHWWWWRMSGQMDWTYVHAFDISDPASAAYIGSGGVQGSVDDQFAMDDKDGYLRVATSTFNWKEDPATPSSFRAELGSRLTVLAPRALEGGGSTLAVVGEIPSLHPDERLMAMRFIGDKGYAVTFRYVDPLITLDLRDPTHPRKVAELTLPGFSSYLQPIDDDHLLAIGVDLPLDSNGRPDAGRRALQLSLFDVSDLSNPRRTAQMPIGTAWAYSEAMWDHHAFNWYRPDPAKPGLLAIPFSDWIQPAPSPWWNGFVSDVRLFSVDPAGSIAPFGSLGMGDAYIQQGTGAWTWWYRPWVRRSVMATDVAGNTYLYAVSDAGVRSAALSALSAPLATALFPSMP